MKVPFEFLNNAKIQDLVLGEKGFISPQDLICIDNELYIYKKGDMKSTINLPHAILIIKTSTGFLADITIPAKSGFKWSNYSSEEIHDINRFEKIENLIYDSNIEIFAPEHANPNTLAATVDLKIIDSTDIVGQLCPVVKKC